jgi:hypothetical protein
MSIEWEGGGVEKVCSNFIDMARYIQLSGTPFDRYSLYYILNEI